MQTILEKTSRILLAASAALLLLPGCTSQPAASAGPMLRVRIRDFKIEPSRPTLDEGPVTLDVWNNGPSTHEFVVVQSDRSAGDLPLAADGLSVDEDAVVPVDELDEVGARTRGTLALTLSPGRYVLFCNLEGHYLAGMHAAIEVTAGA
jgi:uncharacterized cupredoxin-like copper-binding protein